MRIGAGLWVEFFNFELSDEGNLVELINITWAGETFWSRSLFCYFTCAEQGQKLLELFFIRIIEKEKS